METLIYSSRYCIFKGAAAPWDPRPLVFTPLISSKASWRRGRHGLSLTSRDAGSLGEPFILSPTRCLTSTTQTKIDLYLSWESRGMEKYWAASLNISALSVKMTPCLSVTLVRLIHLSCKELIHLSCQSSEQLLFNIMMSTDKENAANWLEVDVISGWTTTWRHLHRKQNTEHKILNTSTFSFKKKNKQ